MTESYIAALVTIAALMTATWLISLPLRNASIVDIVWGLGFVMVAWAVLATAEPSTRSWLMVTLTTAWGLRLTGYLVWRNAGKGEDYRYVEMRERRGTRFPAISLITVFGLQGAIMWIVSLPLQAGIPDESELGLIAGAGVVLWAIGFFFETVGDLQLARFKAIPQNSGRVMDGGLWRYTRHPNYFGDFMVWWGMYLIALDGGAWWTIVGPLVMTALLMKYSGAGLLEKSIGDRRPGYAEYVERTNAFFPGPPSRP